MLTVRLQTEDFCVGTLHRELAADTLSIGAIATFTGLMRDMNLGDCVETMYLEHYPGMTEKALTRISEQAIQRWSLSKAIIVHRVGELAPGDQIVFVGVASQHRGNAFQACEYIMDRLKTEAPFWKKELTATGDRWVDARQSDHDAAQRWSVDHHHDDNNDFDSRPKQG